MKKRKSESGKAEMSWRRSQRRRYIGGIALALVVTCSGCMSVKPLRGGNAATVGAIQQTVSQGENPAQVSKQDQETVRTRSFTLPSGSRVEETRVTSDASGAAITNLHAVIVSEPTPVIEREETRARTELGASQKDTAREIGAKLASLRGIVWIGVAMFVFGIASMFYPPLKLIIGSVTTSAAITIGGLALMVLPTLVVGNELLILAGVAAAVGLWFLAHRHGKLQGFIDANRDGVDDRKETAEVRA